MIVACTGPVGGEGTLMRLAVATGVSAIQEPSEFRTGAAYGVDTACFFAGLTIWRKNTTHRVFVPAGRKYNQDLVGYARQEQIELVRIEGGYMARNDALVDGADLLLAFPRSMQEELRSGTWATVRRAWKRDINVMYYPLDGKCGPVVRCT